MVGPADAAGLAVLPAARREMHELLVRAVDGKLDLHRPLGRADGFACSCEILQPAP
jgi:hypothetical protein